MQFVSNFRDFGGCPARGGGRVAEGLLFRSGQVSPLGTTPFAEVEARRFETVVDLRFADEVAHAPMPWQSDASPQILSLDESGRGDAPHHGFFRGTLNGLDDAHAIYRGFYAGLPLDPRYIDIVGRALRQFAGSEGRVLVHCSAGKDRTGFVCALLLAVLGVERGAIDADYLLSNAVDARQALRPELERRFAAHGCGAPGDATMDVILGVAPEYLDASLGAILAHFGSLRHYFDAIGVGKADRRALRARYLRSGGGTFG